MEVIDQNGTVVNAKFFLTDPLAGKPSKPALGWNPWDHPVQYGWIYLAWGADNWDGLPIEPDLNWSELQRKIGTSAWVTVYSGPNRTWSDHSITYDPNGDTPVYFRVRVRDTQNKWSVWSELFNTRMVNIAWQEKAIRRDIPAGTPSVFALFQNYPNPFNPTTQIRFDLPKDESVTLKVFNMLGKEVATVVKEVQPAGSYSVSFDGSALSSGVYIYTLKAGNYMASKKLLLMK